jgi:hypothetical protein
MVSKQKIGDKFFRWLVEIDEATSREVAARGCSRCGGPLHRGDYPRKPRGGLLGMAAEVFSKRLSLCCGRDGCRRRATPPSVRYLGRRVYVGAVVVLASVFLFTTAARQIRRETGISSRTVRRWGGWWRNEFPHSRLYQEQRGRFLPPLSVEALPASLMERFEGAGREDPEVLVRLLCFLSPLTTGSAGGGARFRRDV